MRDKIRGRAECTSAHGSYYNFLGKKVEKAERDVLFCFDFWFFGCGARWSYCSILQRAFWQHFSQNQFWSRHFFLQLTHQHIQPPYGYDILKKQRAWKNISHQKANQNRFRALSDLFFSSLLHNAILSQKCGLSVLTQKWMANWHHFYEKQKRKSALQTCLIFLVKRMSVTFDTVKLKWVK